ncbi:MsnO8 family LLM class oxidoreductase [Sorangium sp. So ce260]|uniref:MsnO8 family LLM class oxidoreductase n=1 Tax=Sorangium sp. So ce260 TaxID=3133291 RepID=UPI003F61C62A
MTARRFKRGSPERAVAYVRISTDAACASAARRGRGAPVPAQRDAHGSLERVDRARASWSHRVAAMGDATRPPKRLLPAVPIWILGSSLFGAQLAAALGLPYAFASHFAPGQMTQAIALYRREFRPSDELAEPRVMLGVNVVAAGTDEEARRLWTSLQQAFVNLRRGRPGPLPPPNDDFEREVSPLDRAGLEQALACSVVGSPETVRRGLDAFIARTRADELIVSSPIFDHAARVRSIELTAAARDELARAG